MVIFIFKHFLKQSANKGFHLLW